MASRSPDGRPLRCFVGFFGITRGLERVITGIERNIFAPLDRASVTTVCAAHLNVPDILDAPRSGENKVRYGQDDLTRLRLDHQVVERQSDENIAEPLAVALTRPLMFDEPDPDGTVHRNAVCQLYSLKRLGELFEQSRPDDYDLVVIARPDLRYIDRMPLHQILAQLGVTSVPGLGRLRRRFRPAASLITPSWQQWDGLNDRFAFATPTGARTYFNRLDHLPEFCRSRPAFQGEGLLKFAAERDGLRLATTWMRAERVRSDGGVAPRDVPGRKERLRRAAIYPLHRMLQI